VGVVGVVGEVAAVIVECCSGYLIILPYNITL
jgi:hypothetical protein